MEVKPLMVSKANTTAQITLAALVLGGGILVMGHTAGLWEDAGAFAWVTLFRSARTIQVPARRSWPAS